MDEFPVPTVWATAAEISITASNANVAINFRMMDLPSWASLRIDGGGKAQLQGLEPYASSKRIEGRGFRTLGSTEESPAAKEQSGAGGRRPIKP